jgi:predicted Zn-dependent peptidase
MFQDLYADFHGEQLANGLSVYVKEWPSASWFYAGVVIHAGAREDPGGRSGLAHLVEHVVGENVSPLTFAQLERLFKTLLGGYAWFGTTTYYSSEYKFHLPNETHKIQKALDLFGQMLLLPKELTQNIEEEKAVILREYHRSYEHEQARNWALQGRPWLFEHHHRLQSYHSAIGVPDGFMGGTKQEIQVFYDSHYVPKNCSLVCIGALGRQTLLSLLQDTPFAVQKSGQRTPLPEPFFPESPQRHGQIIRMAEFSRLAQWEAAISFEWVLPLHFERRCVQLFCDLFEERLIEELRYQWHLTYAVTVSHVHYQDCRTIRVSFKTAPDAVERAQDLFWQVLRSLDQEEEKYDENKQETLASIHRMDYSGYDLLESAMDDLAGYHRLISFSEEIQQVQHITFECIVELARYLTYERHFCFILQP